MKLSTKFTVDKEPVLITGGSFDKAVYITRYLAIQARVVYENGDTEYVDFERVKINEYSVDFNLK